MNFFSRTISSILITLVLLSSVFSPTKTVWAFDASAAAEQVSGPCLSNVAEKMLEETIASTAVTMAALEAVGTVTSVPIQNVTIQEATSRSATNQTYIEPWYTCVGYGIGQLVLKELTDETIAWIRGGFNGSPSYAIDTHKLFTDLTDMVAGNLARDIRNLNMCNFTVNFKNDLANYIETSGNNRAKLPEKFQCPFDDTLDLYASNLYRAGQRVSWNVFEKTLTDSGNPFGVAVMAAEELTRAQEQEVHIQEQRLSWGRGFLEIIDENNCTYPEGITKEMIDDMVNTDPAKAASFKKTYCAVTTPGVAIESQLTQTLGVKMDRLKLADNFSKIVSALITELSNESIKSVFKKI